MTQYNLVIKLNGLEVLYDTYDSWEDANMYRQLLVVIFDLEQLIIEEIE